MNICCVPLKLIFCFCLLLMARKISSTIRTERKRRSTTIATDTPAAMAGVESLSMSDESSSDLGVPSAEDK